MPEHKSENRENLDIPIKRGIGIGGWLGVINTILLVVAILSIFYFNYYIPNAEKEFAFKMDLVRGPFCTVKTPPYYVEDMNAFNHLTVWDNYWNEQGTGYIVAQKCLIFNYGYLTREAFNKFYEQPRVQVKFKIDTNKEVGN